MYRTALKKLRWKLYEQQVDMCRHRLPDEEWIVFDSVCLRGASCTAAAKDLALSLATVVARLIPAMRKTSWGLTVAVSREMADFFGDPVWQDVRKHVIENKAGSLSEQERQHLAEAANRAGIEANQAATLDENFFGPELWVKLQGDAAA